jgi:dihydroorotase
MTQAPKLTLPRGDDLHLHLRDGPALAAILPHTVERFARAVVMPNLKPPVTTTALALDYRSRILAALPPGSRFEPLMTLYLTDHTPPDEIDRAVASGVVVGVKWYPAGATTHADAGVTDPRHIQKVLERMQKLGMPLLVHAEVTDPAVDVFDREAVFIERNLMPLLESHPELKLVMEHVTTAEGVAFVQHAPGRVAATVTAHHLLLNRNALFAGGLRPHHYCLPVLKRERHREALIAAVTAGDQRFFLGTDSAPHARRAKESDCGCAGMYTAHAALELYAEVFEARGALHRLADFAGRFGALFYGLPPGNETITLVRRPWTVPASYPYSDDELVPFRASQTCHWQREM